VFLYFDTDDSVAPLLATDGQLNEGALGLNRSDLLLQVFKSFRVNSIFLEQVESADVWITPRITATIHKILDVDVKYFIC
jgi:hypothetical protein